MDNYQNNNISQPQAVDNSQFQPQGSDSGGSSSKKKYLLFGGVLVLILALVLMIVFFPSGGDGNAPVGGDDGSGSNFDGDLNDDSGDGDDNSLLEISLNEDDFEVENYAFSYSSDKLDIDSRNPSAEFILGEDVFLFLDVAGFAHEKRGAKYYHEVVEDVVVYSPSGEVVVDLTAKGVDISSGLSSLKYDNIEFFLQIQTYNLKESGRYRVELTYHDLLSGEDVVESYSFVLNKVSDIAAVRTASFASGLSDIGVGEEEEFIQKVEIYDAEGNLLEDLSFEETYETPSGFNGDYLNEFVIPSYYDEGQYVVKLILENVESGESSEYSKTVLVENDLLVSSYTFSDYEMIGDRSIPKINNEYLAGEQVYLHMALEGFTQSEVEGGYRYYVYEDLEVYDPSGDKVVGLSKTNVLDEDAIVENKLAVLNVENAFFLPEYTPSGEFKIVVKFYDGFTDEMYVKEIPLRVRGSWEFEE